MNPWSSFTHWVSSAWHSVTSHTQISSSGWASFWHSVVAVGQALDWVVRDPFTATAESLQYIADALTFNQQGMAEVAKRESQWIWGNQVQPVRVNLGRILRALLAALRRALAAQWRHTLHLYEKSLKHAHWLFLHERRARVRQVREVRAFLLRHDRWVLQVVQQEAASAYNAQLPARLGLVGKLLDELATRNPLISGLVNDLVTGALDLAEIDDPLIRLVAGRVLAQLVDRAGVDQPAAALAQSLLGPILGQPRATDLHNTIGDLADRIAALESWQATFMADGGSQILQAGEGWQELTGILTGGALLAFFIEWTTDPAGFATRALADVSGPVNTAIASAASFISKG